uniref:Uncharacterized protein n=1 Tax=Oryza punctata TaxID=4537 RepID=A0A0E0M361_ORYPU
MAGCAPACTADVAAAAAVVAAAPWASMSPPRALISDKIKPVLAYAELMEEGGGARGNNVGVGVDLGSPGCYLDSQVLRPADSLYSLLADSVHGDGSLEEHLHLVVEVEERYPEHGASEEHHEVELGPDLVGEGC